jgi:hypothetical protein
MKNSAAKSRVRTTILGRSGLPDPLNDILILFLLPSLNTAFTLTPSPPFPESPTFLSWGGTYNRLAPGYTRMFKGLDRSRGDAGADVRSAGGGWYPSNVGFTRYRNRRPRRLLGRCRGIQAVHTMIASPCPSYQHPTN